MKICILMICLCFYGVGEQSCKSKIQDSKSEKNRNNDGKVLNNVETQEPEYEVLKVGCTEDEKCIVIAYCDPTLFNEAGMEKIAEKLSIDFREKKVVNVNLFDERERAKAYAKGTRNLGDLQNERRGWYLRTDDREFLLFFPDPTRQGKPISIKPKRHRN